MHEVLVNCLFKLAQEESVLRSTDRPAMTMAVDLGHKATKPTNQPKSHVRAQLLWVVLGSSFTRVPQQIILAKTIFLVLQKIVSNVETSIMKYYSSLFFLFDI